MSDLVQVVAVSISATLLILVLSVWRDLLHIAARTLGVYYPPALLYRGQVLYETKKDIAGAVRAW